MIRIWIPQSQTANQPTHSGVKSEKRVAPITTQMGETETGLEYTGLRRAVSNVYGNRCESDCRFRGREFDPILLWRLIMKWFLQSFSSLVLDHSRRVVVSYKLKYVHEVLVNRLFKLAQEKSVVRWPDRPAMTIAVDLGRKATKQTKVWNRHFLTSKWGVSKMIVWWNGCQDHSL